MNTDTETTKVIFRKWHNGDIIALFPEIPGTNDPFTCLSYEHIGQHGAAQVSIIGITTAANEREYKDLFNELQNCCGYRLQVCQRFARNAFDIRHAALQEYTP